MIKKITLFAGALAVALTASATVHSVDSISGYPIAYGAAQSGDTVLLHEGTYANQKFPVGKIITVMGAEGEEVILTGEIKADAADFQESGITFENLCIGDGASYLFNFKVYGTVKKIELKNCEVRNVNRCTLNNDRDGEGKIDEVRFEGCTLHDLNAGNWNFIYANAAVLKFTMTECTVYNCNGMESIYNPRTSYDLSHEFTFTHNTYYSGCRDANRSLCNVAKNFKGEDSKITVTDNILVAPDGAVGGKVFNIGAGYWEGTVANNLLVGWSCAELNADFGDVTVENNYSLEDLGVASATALFADAANADFTHFIGVSVLEGKGIEGGVLGAQAWLKDGGTLYTLTTALAEGVPAEAGSISGPTGKVQGGKEITLTAVKNYGYQFTKWVDASGNTLSTDAVYTFTVNTDTEVYAVFEALTMYTLTVNCVGGGNYSLSEAGANGEYTLYEAGTELVLSTLTNHITEFIMATDEQGNMYFNPEFTFVMDRNITLTVEFETKDYICGWDQFTGPATNNYAPDYISKAYAYNTDSTNTPVMQLYYTLYPEEPWGGWWNRDGQALIWIRCNESGDGTTYDNDSTKFYKDQGYFYQFAFSTKGYKSDVIAMFSMKKSYRSYNTYKLQYSLNNLSWETIKEITVSGGMTSYVDTIPTSTDKEMIYYRIYPSLDPNDFEQNKFFDTYGLYIDDIFFLAEEPLDGLNGVETEAKETLIYDIMGRRVSDMERPGLYIVNGKKYLVK